MKKIFIGLPLPQNITQEISKWIQKNKNLPVRWLKEENWHITLLPPWYEKEENIEKVINKIERIKNKLKPFKVKFLELSLGPNPKNPRLIWITGFSEEFNKNKKTIEKDFRFFEKRQPLIHITIARFKNHLKMKPEKIDWEGFFDKIVLYESLPLSHYSKIYETRLS